MAYISKQPIDKSRLYTVCFLISNYVILDCTVPYGTDGCRRSHNHKKVYEAFRLHAGKGRS